MRQIAIANTVKSTMPTGIFCSSTNTRSPPALPLVGGALSSHTVPTASTNGRMKIQKM
jgi:hypothetical protein